MRPCDSNEVHTESRELTWKIIETYRNDKYALWELRDLGHRSFTVRLIQRDLDSFREHLALAQSPSCWLCQAGLWQRRS